MPINKEFWVRLIIALMSSAATYLSTANGFVSMTVG